MGRLLVSGVYIFYGLNNLINLQKVTQYASSKNVPAILVPLSAIMLLLGGLSILLGYYPAVGVLLIVIFLVPAAFIMHRFWGVDEKTAAMQMPHFMKNIALAGSALMFLAIPTPWSFSIG